MCAMCNKRWQKTKKWFFHVLRYNSWYQLERIAILFSFSIFPYKHPLHHVNCNFPQKTGGIYFLGLWLCIQTYKLFWSIDQVGSDSILILSLVFRSCMLIEFLTSSWENMLRLSCWSHGMGESNWNAGMVSVFHCCVEHQGTERHLRLYLNGLFPREEQTQRESFSEICVCGVCACAWVRLTMRGKKTTCFLISLYVLLVQSTNFNTLICLAWLFKRRDEQCFRSIGIWGCLWRGSF